jgi:IS30 family transposase
MKHFTLTKRIILAELLEEKKSYREISKVINKVISAISDEIRHNSVNGNYDPYKAHAEARKRKIEKGKRKKLEISSALKDYVVEKLKEEWSPEQIAGELKEKAQGKTVISHETIYLFIYSEKGKKEKLWLYLRHRKKPERVPWGTRKKRKITIPNRTSIHERPDWINRREEYAHWEGDLMLFSQRNEALAVFVERYSRKTVAVLLDNKKASSMELALHELLASTGQTNVKSITFDNGSENVCHQKVRLDYVESFETFFCDPYCSWQKGTVENTNKLLRQYLPRKIEEQKLNQDYLDSVIEKLNNRPRKCLKYNTPNQIFKNCSV